MAALIVGSSLALFADKGPTILKIPVLGLIGYIISFALGIYLVVQYIMFDMDWVCIINFYIWKLQKLTVK